MSAEGGKRKGLNKHSLELDGGVRERLSSQEGASLTSDLQSVLVTRRQCWGGGKGETVFLAALLSLYFQ